MLVSVITNNAIRAHTLFHYSCNAAEIKRVFIIDIKSDGDSMFVSFYQNQEEYKKEDNLTAFSEKNNDAFHLMGKNLTVPFESMITTVIIISIIIKLIMNCNNRTCDLNFNNRLMIIFLIRMSSK